MRKYPQQSVCLLRDGEAASNQVTTDRRAAVASKLKTLSSSVSSSSGSSSLAAKKKVEELFRRLQPHSLVLSTEKLLAALRIAPKLFVNGEEMLSNAPPAATVAMAAGMGSRRPVSTTIAWRFKPEMGRFRYGMSLRYTPNDPELALSSLKDAQVLLTSSIMNTPRCLSLSIGSTLSSKSWKLVAETDRRVGLALYELPLGDWRASSLVALVWTKKLEVARFFLQFHTTELLFSAPPRPLQVRRDDDLDRTHGLHSYTTTISLRSLNELFWEREMYQVAFPTPEKGARTVSVQLLDNVHGGSVAARDRVLSSETGPSFKLETEAVKYAMDNCLVVDFTLWDADCVPVWGFTRVLELKATSSQQDEDEGDVDLSVSSLGGTASRLQMRFQDAVRGNELAINLTKLSRSKKDKIWVSRIDLVLSLEFINATFGTKY
ncbi:hypothetical protein V7S43_006228 [Phytophthora oleae]|uniref:Uncharacterized protein n=1 Tax=Phytophthora oleae TaxID=2107226 RepID=A0ABD3FPT5_9STRA